MLRSSLFLLLLLSGIPALADTEISPFAKNVVRHVLMHELAHALIREFDLPVLGNEENIADSLSPAARGIVTTWKFSARLPRMWKAY